MTLEDEKIKLSKREADQLTAEIDALNKTAAEIRDSREYMSDNAMTLKLINEKIERLSDIFRRVQIIEKGPDRPHIGEILRVTITRIGENNKPVIEEEDFQLGFEPALEDGIYQLSIIGNPLAKIIHGATMGMPVSSVDHAGPIEVTVISAYSTVKENPKTL